MDHHFSTKKQEKNPRKFACDEKKNKKTLSISVQLCLVRCEKIQNRDSPESEKKSPGTGKIFRPRTENSTLKKKYKFGFS